MKEPLSKEDYVITDVNYPELSLTIENVSDHQYIYELQEFEWNKAKRLKQDKGYMGIMSFPENLDKPARTVMATMSSSSRESMILSLGTNKYRLPTVREVASMMSFPIDYRFYGKSKGTKYTLVGNAVPPKMSYAIAIAIAYAEGETVPKHYPFINHDDKVEFYNLNYTTINKKDEKVKRDISKFKYHIPYLIISSYRVELTNYHSNFKSKTFKWDAEIHYSQGKEKADIFIPKINLTDIPKQYRKEIQIFIKNYYSIAVSYNRFQEIFCMTLKQRENINVVGPYQLLDLVKFFLIENLTDKEQSSTTNILHKSKSLPLAIVIGYYILSKITEIMEELNNMNATTRKEKLAELRTNQNNIAMTGIPLRYRGETRTEVVYKIPLDYLIYNKYNGRIGTDVHSYEKQNGQLNAEVENDKIIIEKFLYESKIDRNKTTMDSLQKAKQQRYGIITSDGIIVDGNRRAMLLNKLFHKRETLNLSYKDVEHCQYF